MHDTPDHSFAVMAYLDSPYLKACLDSIRQQTVKSDFFICTSTPSDFIRDIAREYGVELLISNIGTGMANDWTFSLRQAKTKYVTLAHQDDLYDPEYAESCMKAVLPHRDVLICFTDYTELVGEEERTHNQMLRIKRLMLHLFMPWDQLRTSFWKSVLLCFGNPISAPSVMFNRSRLEEFTFSPSFLVNVDWDAWQRMIRMKGRFVYVDRPLMKHRIHQESATTSAIEGHQRKKEDWIIFRRFWPAWRCLRTSPRACTTSYSA